MLGQIHTEVEKEGIYQRTLNAIREFGVSKLLSTSSPKEK